MNKFAFLSAVAVAAVVAPAAGYAQEITSVIEGTVTDEAGAPVAGATVIVTDLRTGTSRTISADSGGRFSARGLTVGGPYSVTATAAGFQGQTVEGLNTSTQGATTLSFNLTAAEAADAGTIVVTAQRANVQLRAIGPGQAFGEDVLDNVPSFTNDIRDVIRIDPRVSLDRDFEVDRVSCLGANDRSNTFTVDGQVQADVFGLNGTPFASRTVTPLPYDAIRQTSVEFAPFDVQYGQFTGCAINVVSRSGTNDIHGSAFFTYTGSSLNGDTLRGNAINFAPFDEYRWGATLGGPLIRDKLFLFAAYEESDTGDAQERGPIGAGFSNEQAFVTEAQFNEISQIIRDTYGVDTGPIGRTLAETSRRFFGRLDWYVSDNHRLELTYQRLDETDIGTSDLNANVLTGYNSFVNRGTASNYYSGRFYSTWNDRFSTEVRVSRAEVRDIQDPVGGTEATGPNPSPRIVVGVQNGTAQGSIVAGPSFSQSGNDLYTRIMQGRLSGNYDAGGHRLTVGMEVNHLNAYNLFLQNATGTLTFRNIDDLRAGLLSGGTNTNPTGEQILAGSGAGAYGNFSATGDINDVAARFERAIWSVYAQDEWSPTDALKILAGVRMDWFSGDAPPHNANFQARYGFSNAVSFSAIDPVILPRFAITYDMDPGGLFSRTQVRAGVGIFSGGDPAVWFSNAFSNNGRASGAGSSTSPLCDPFETNGRLTVLQNGQFTGFPQCVVTAGQNQGAIGDARVQSTDPNIKQPTVVRANFGIATDLNFGGGGGGFLDGWRLNLDYIYSYFRDPFQIVDLTQTPDIRVGLAGQTIDGRPIYQTIDPLRAGCNAVLQGTGGTPPVYTGVTPVCFTTARDDELQLTNADSASSHVASIILSKRFRGGLFTSGGSSFFSAGYSYTNSKDRSLMNNSTATSNYDNVAAYDRQNLELGTSSYETRHNFTMGASFGNEFFGNLETRIGFVFTAREGRPYNTTFGGSGVLSDAQSGSNNALLYVPTGISDPNVVYTATGSGQNARTAAENAELFDAYINANPCISRYRGSVVPRNSCRNSWYKDLDLQFSQELPGPLANDRLRLILNFDNFLNFLDDSWNILQRKSASNQNVNVIALNSIDSQGRYVLGAFNPFDGNSVQNSASLWRIQVGLRYRF